MVLNGCSEQRAIEQIEDTDAAKYLIDPAGTIDMRHIRYITNESGDIVVNPNFETYQEK